jgi:DNA topoisomerase I
VTRLRRIKREDLDIARHRHGRGFVYRDRNDQTYRDKGFLVRAMSLAIPPAWTEVRVARDPLAHIQACGLDAAGRMQYIYHPEWEVRRARKKQRQLALLTSALTRIRRRVADDLDAQAGDKRLALAIGVALIDRTAMRVGRERYLDAHGTRGAGTLFTRDVSVKGDKVSLRFPAKSGKLAEYDLVDAKLAAALTKAKTIPGKRLLMYRDESLAPKAVRADDINRYLRDLSGAAVTAKDFRTLHASALAGEALVKLERGASPSARKRQIANVTRSVAAFLRNTPPITRKSYIAPCLFALFEDAKLSDLWALTAERHDGLRRREAGLAEVLQAAG